MKGSVALVGALGMRDLHDVMGVTVEDFVPIYSGNPGFKFCLLWPAPMGNAACGRILAR